MSEAAEDIEKTEAGERRSRKRRTRRILIAVLVVAFLAWEIFFSRSGQKAMVDQHRAEGNDEPPKTF